MKKVIRLRSISWGSYIKNRYYDINVVHSLRHLCCVFYNETMGSDFCPKNNLPFAVSPKFCLFHMCMDIYVVCFWKYGAWMTFHSQLHLYRQRHLCSFIDYHKTPEPALSPLISITFAFWSGVDMFFKLYQPGAWMTLHKCRAIFMWLWQKQICCWWMSQAQTCIWLFDPKIRCFAPLCVGIYCLFVLAPGTWMTVPPCFL